MARRKEDNDVIRDAVRVCSLAAWVIKAENEAEKALQDDDVRGLGYALDSIKNELIGIMEQG
ncbi:hypothetical protein FACS189483_02630 [Spirochaetia bacterium]|nr:hypothetical protein FACS189483_02630 [Spirochaetia bacterium]